MPSLSHARDQNDAIRALAQALAGTPDFTERIRDDTHAAAFLFAVLHDARCPECHASRCALRGTSIHCTQCGTVSRVTAYTFLARTRLPIRVWLAAIWHVLVDTETISGAAFSRRYRIPRRQTGWQLLHVVRRAIPYPAPSAAGSTAQILGRHSPRNTAWVTMAAEPYGGISAVVAHEASPAPRPSAPETALFLGRLRQWIATAYCGVTARYLDRYLAELVARYRRVRLTVVANAWSSMRP